MNFLKIKSAQNGYVLESVIDSKCNLAFVFEHDGSEEKEAESLKNLFLSIKELYGPNDSRYSKYRVVITIEPGDKYEDQNDCEG